MKRWAAALATVGVVMAGAVFAPPLTPAASAATCAYAPVSIAVVVDFGDGSLVSAVCVPADSRDSGIDLLNKRFEMLGTDPPRINSSGLVCAIDGVPDEGCGDQVDSKYAYWSYWRGTADGGWAYSNTGPQGIRVVPTKVEGWRFQPKGAGNPSDPPPRGSADPGPTCSPPSPATSATSTPTSSEASATTPAKATPSSTGDAIVESESESTTTSVSSSSPASSTASSSGQVAAAPVRVTSRDKGGGPVVGVLAGGGLVVALGVSGAVISHRRRASP